MTFSQAYVKKSNYKGIATVVKLYLKVQTLLVPNQGGGVNHNRVFVLKLGLKP